MHTNSKPAKWLGTHCVDGSTAGTLMKYARMGDAWPNLDAFKRQDVLRAVNRRTRIQVHDGSVNPFTGKRDDSVITPVSFVLSDGTKVTGSYWINGHIALVTERGTYYRGRYVK